MNRKIFPFQKWEPTASVDNVYDIDAVVQDKNGLTLTLVPDNLDYCKRSEHKLIIRWEDPISYHISNESIREDCWISDPDEAWTFFFGHSSSYIDHFKTNAILFPENTIHFLIRGTNYIADILSTDYPYITIQNN